MSKILVTGGAGFVGYHLSKRLAEEGHQVILCDNLSRGRLDKDLLALLGKHRNCKLLTCDLTDRNELEKLGSGYDRVFHLAAIVGVIYANEKPEKVLRTNVLSTVNILDWFVESKSKRILFSSSSEVYAGNVKYYKLPIPTPEDVPLFIADTFNPRTSYLGSKILGELLFINYARAYGIDMRIIRYHNVYGPRMGFEHVIPELSMRVLKRENPCKVYGPEQTRAFCYIDDAAEATIRIMESKNLKSEIVNVGNDAQEIRMDALASKIFAIASHSPAVEPLPAGLGSPERRCPDINKLISMTGFEPKVRLDEGLKKTFQWYQEYFEANK